MSTAAPHGAAPKLLAGGNPQIPKGYGEGPVQAYLAAMPTWKGDIGRRLDELVSSAVPNVYKAVKWNSPFYGIPGLGWFLSFHCFDNFVRVTFFQGTSLKPVPPGSSKTEGTRYWDLREADEIDVALGSSWFVQASKLPGWVTADIEA